MKETYYFSHDYNARNDPKILAMRSEYGAEGYGWYWMIIEILREQPEYKLEYNKYLCITLAMQLQCDKNALHEYVEKCINEYKLFESDGTYFWSNSLLRRMSEKDAKNDAKSEKARKAANARWHKDSETKKTDENNTENDAKKNASDAPAMHEQCIAMLKEKKGKEKKIKDNVVIKKENKEKENWVVALDYFCQKSGKPDAQLRISEREAAQKVCEEVPILETVLKGIDKAFADFKPDTDSDKINSFKYCVPVIKKLYAGLQNKNSKKNGGGKRGSSKQDTDSGEDSSPYDFSRFGG
ncbi:DUF4373 domain-containing protein [Clostridium sp. BJN0013]|uniref:DUF4373 domain-containing protein n=1 Tax=Clostridium sp. BJN0013 TaxID=3236840 RepID=UPI0034C69226